MSMTMRHFRCGVLLVGVMGVMPTGQGAEGPRSVRAEMLDVIKPATDLLWGAFEIQANQWPALQAAAEAVVASSERLRLGGSGPNDSQWANEPEWQAFADQMGAAGRAALEAIRARNESALFDAGNDLLYPPCESCHTRYMAQ